MSGFPPFFPEVESAATLIVERVVNSLPEGLLLAGLAAVLVRLIGRQNAGTRFAVWLIALAGVAGLPLLSALPGGGRNIGALSHAEFSFSDRWAVAFLAIWIFVACLALARVAAGLWQLRQIRRTAREISPADLDPTLRNAMDQARITAGRKVALLISETARVPAAIGFRRPAIVLPAWSLREMSADELAPILIHEMAHLRRWDDWTNLLQKSVRAVLFFHPAVWWIDTRLSLEREMACDDAVLAATGNARAYAGSLIGLLERGCARRGWKMAQAAVARAREASMRIARILQGGPATTRIGRGVIGVAAMLCVICGSLVEYAPRLVNFGSEATTSLAQSQRTEFSAERRSAFHAPEVVPATFHPAPTPRSVAIHASTSSTPVHRTPQLATAKRERPVASSAIPPVVMASLKMNSPRSSHYAGSSGAPSAVRLVMVMESEEVAYGTVQSTGGDAGTDRLSLAEAPAMQVQTMQVITQAANGWQVRTWQVRRYGVMLVAPSAQVGTKQSSI